MIIVDESGSMSIIKKQALAGLNETIDTVKKMQKMHPEMQQRISLLTFDSSHKTLHPYTCLLRKRRWSIHDGSSSS